MASLGHIAVGLFAGRLLTWTEPSRARFIKASLALSAISMLPDADVIAFVFRIPYEAPWGHRGATHSFGFAVLCGLVFWGGCLALRTPMRKALILSGTVAAVMASHGLLDTLTDGGLGAALLWPISDERFFAPWRPIPVSPIGRAFISMRGLRILFTELAFFSPLVIFALWPRKAAPRPDRD